ncbi:MAG: ROK family protein [Desulfurococcales archaeon]|nr:ROK family protein [Desulfurococcales archaeon]
MNAEEVKSILAVDVGATNLRVALFHGRLLKNKVKSRTPRSGGSDAVALEIIRLARDALKVGEVDAIGVASIGPLDLKRGWVVNTPNNPLRNFELKRPLKEEFQAPVYIANDCVAAVWGEKTLGRGSPYSDLAYITISTGIGGGFIVDGELLVGWRGNAHEIGHIVVDYNSNIRCGCGGLGHWEGIAGGNSIPKTARIYALKWEGDRTNAYEMALEGKLSSEVLYRLARLGDKFAESLVDYLNRVHAAGIASIIASYDPQVIYLGGSVFLENKDIMLDNINRYLSRFSIFKSPPLVPATFGHDEVLYGAAAIALKPPRSLIRV